MSNAAPVDSLASQPLLRDIFELPKKLSPSMSEEVGKYFLKTFVPASRLGTGANGVVFEMSLKTTNPSSGYPHDELVVTADGSIGFADHRSEDIVRSLLPPGRSRAPARPNVFTVAVKLQMVGINDYEGEELIAAAKQELAVANLLSSTTVGVASDLKTFTPYLKTYSQFYMKMSYAELFSHFRHYATMTIWANTSIGSWFLGLDPDSDDEDYDDGSAEFMRQVIESDVAKNNQVILFVQVTELAARESVSSFLTRDSNLSGMLQIIPTQLYLQNHVTPMLLHCLCTFHLFHQLLGATHYDARPTNWFMRKMRDNVVIRYDVASNLTFWIPAKATLGFVPFLGDIGVVGIHPKTGVQKFEARESFSNLLGSTNRSAYERLAESAAAYGGANPGFDLQQFSLEFVGRMSYETLNKMSLEMWSLLMDMAAEWPKSAAEDRELSKFSSWFVFRRGMNLMEEIKQAKKSSLDIEPETASDLTTSALSCAWTVFNPSSNSDAREAAIFSKYHDMFSLWTVPPTDKNVVVVDLGIRIGDRSGGTLPPIVPASESLGSKDATMKEQSKKSRPLDESKKTPFKRIIFAAAEFDVGDFVANALDCCWLCDSIIDSEPVTCSGCHEAVYCSGECLEADLADHQLHEHCSRAAVPLMIEAAPGDENDREELRREAKEGEEEMKNRKVKPIKTSRTRRLIRFLIRQGGRALETAGSAIGGVFGLDTVVDVGVFIGIEFPMFIAPIVSVLRSGGDLARFLRFFVTTRQVKASEDSDEILTVGPFQGGIAGVEHTMQPMIDGIIAKNPAILKLLQRVCLFIDSMADKIAGSLASALEVIAVEFFGIARFTSYQALYGAFTRGSKKMAGVVRRLYEKIPTKARAWFEDFEKTVELMAKIKVQFMKIFDMLAAKAPPKTGWIVRRLREIMAKATPKKIALALHSVLALGYVALMIRARCQ